MVDDTRQFLHLLSTHYFAEGPYTQAQYIATAFSCCRGASELLKSCIFPHCCIHDFLEAFRNMQPLKENPLYLIGKDAF